MISILQSSWLVYFLQESWLRQGRPEKGSQKEQVDTHGGPGLDLRGPTYMLISGAMPFILIFIICIF